ncbi:MAG: LysR family transcriptional regulator [Roseiflexaceae bacterium]
MTLVQLQVFVAVVESGSFTAAAERLGMTQSATSHALAGLEAALGVRLLERHRQGVTPTMVGGDVLAHARAMLAESEHIRQLAAATRGLAAGRLRIGSFHSVSARLLPGIFRAFQQRYQGIEVVLFEGTDQEVSEWIQTRIVDVGFVTGPAAGFETTEIAQDELYVIVAGEHRLARAAHVHVAQLVAEPFILSKAGCEPLIRDIYRQADVAFHARYEISDVATILAMVQEGLGASIIPELSIPEGMPGIVALRLEPPVYRHLSLATLSGATPPAVQAFIHQAQLWAETQGYHRSPAVAPARRRNRATA